MTVRTSNPVIYTLDTVAPLSGRGWEIQIRTLLSTAASAILGNWKSFTFSKVLSDVGSATVTLDLDDPMLANPQDGIDRLALLLDQQAVLEFYYDGVWTFGFLVDQPVQSLAEDNETRELILSGEGIGSLFAWTTVLAQIVTVDYSTIKWSWVNVPAMEAWTDLWTVGFSRGASCSLIYPTFNDDYDSNGVLWSDTQTMEAEVGSNVLERLRQFAELAGVDWQVYRADYESSVYNLKAAQTFGVDKSNSVRFFIGHNQLNNKITRDRKSLANTIYVKRPDSFIISSTDAASVATWKRREAFLDAPNAGDHAAIQRFADLIRDNNKDQQVSISIKITPTTGTQPFVDFDIGDTIWAQSVDGSSSNSYKVTAIGVSVDENGIEEWEITLVSNLELKLIQLQRIINQTTNASLVGGTNIETSPPYTPPVMEDGGGNPISGGGLPGDPLLVASAFEIVINEAAYGSVQPSPPSNAGLAIFEGDNGGIKQYAIQANYDIAYHAQDNPEGSLSEHHLGITTSNLTAGSGSTWTTPIVSGPRQYDLFCQTTPTTVAIKGSGSRIKISLFWSAGTNGPGGSNVAWGQLLSLFGFTTYGAPNVILTPASVEAMKCEAVARGSSAGSCSIYIKNWPLNNTETYTWYLTAF